MNKMSLVLKCGNKGSDTNMTKAVSGQAGPAFPAPLPNNLLACFRLCLIRRVVRRVGRQIL